jgi:hypothetical protein
MREHDLMKGRYDELDDIGVKIKINQSEGTPPLYRAI